MVCLRWIHHLANQKLQQMQEGIDQALQQAPPRITCWSSGHGILLLFLVALTRAMLTLPPEVFTSANLQLLTGLMASCLGKA